ncbi:DNA starvation/stationary phase protection protein [Rubellicoccus peritrichatus]|uniref:DNA starvation/stationary phase protection protein n=1 Tax=Rubellicoccus peritrichatus TaxID=3080537 RepID=A0AAQ3LAH3_9BACT|nr:DNA starvation/stationary phase protection protein [Puniceicoccus sp. CR14]WOO42096.1 DNA starvation/stationary phase protection protein [Puniceicoccus sp. CR14]
MPKRKKSRPDTNSIAETLRPVLADTYALMAQTHLCHWNVEGPSFFALHAAFEMQYTELFQASDEIAERIRALGDYSPGGLESLARIANMTELPEKATAEKMAASLIENHSKLIKDAAKAREIASEADDKETEDLMIARIQVHEKTVWMLKSFLK